MIKFVRVNLPALSAAKDVDMLDVYLCAVCGAAHPRYVQETVPAVVRTHFSLWDTGGRLSELCPLCDAAVWGRLLREAPEGAETAMWADILAGEARAITNWQGSLRFGALPAEPPNIRFGGPEIGLWEARPDMALPAEQRRCVKLGAWAQA